MSRMIMAVIVGLALVSIGISLKIYYGMDYVGIAQAEEARDASLEFISGTEYSVNDADGQTIVALRDWRRRFINTTCALSIEYPDKSVFLSDTVMLQDLQHGTYYHHFTVGSEIGNYDQSVKCIVNGENMTSNKAFHVANLSMIIATRILEAETSLQDSIDTVMDALNCSLNPNITMCGLLNNLQNISQEIIISTNISGDIENIEDYLIDINGSQSTVFYEIEAEDCLLGTYWDFCARVTNEAGQSLRFLDCGLNTSRFGQEAVGYNATEDCYHIRHPCLSPDEVIYWDFECVRNY